MSVPAQYASADEQAVLASTRQSWHRVAEWLLAGPQHREAGTIRLQVVPGGFATRDGSIRVELDELVLADGRRVRLEGTLADVAADAGVVGGAPDGLYTDNSDASPSSPLAVDRGAASALAGWLERGTAALSAFAPTEDPVLWPEHFDVGIGVDEVNYGITPGDAHQPMPYAYVGPWTPREGAFWNAPFGAMRTWSEVEDEASVQAFFVAGQKLAAGG